MKRKERFFSAIAALMSKFHGDEKAAKEFMHALQSRSCRPKSAMRFRQQTRDPAKQGTRAAGKTYEKPWNYFEAV